MDYLKKKDEPRRLLVCGSIDCKRWGYLMPEKSRTRTIMDTQRGKQSEKLHKSPRQYF